MCLAAVYRVYSLMESCRGVGFTHEAYQCHCACPEKIRPNMFRHLRTIRPIYIVERLT